jgi:hypothetical protein
MLEPFWLAFDINQKTRQDGNSVGGLLPRPMMVDTAVHRNRAHAEHEAEFDLSNIRTLSHIGEQPELRCHDDRSDSQNPPSWIQPDEPFPVP